MPAYVDEDGVDPARNTETLAEATFEVRTDRWQGVPFTLRSGKALEPAVREIALTFRPVRHLPEQFSGQTTPDVLRFRFGPDVMSLHIDVHNGTHPFELKPAELSADLGSGSVHAYAEVLSGILDGDATLFAVCLQTFITQVNELGPAERRVYMRNWWWHVGRMAKPDKPAWQVRHWVKDVLTKDRPRYVPEGFGAPVILAQC